jgi:hypothetical protein
MQSLDAVEKIKLRGSILTELAKLRLESLHEPDFDCQIPIAGLNRVIIPVYSVSVKSAFLLRTGSTGS